MSSTAFYLREEKDDNKVLLEDKDLEVIGTPLIKYGDSTVIIQHMETGLWLSYRVKRREYFSYDTSSFCLIILHVISEGPLHPIIIPGIRDQEEGCR